MLLIVVNLTLELLATFHRDICTGHTAAMAQILVVGLVGLNFFLLVTPKKEGRQLRTWDEKDEEFCVWLFWRILENDVLDSCGFLGLLLLLLLSLLLFLLIYLLSLVVFSLYCK